MRAVGDMARPSRQDAVERERRRRGKPQSAPAQRTPTTAAPSRREAARTCGWCGNPIEIKATGRIPKWCSASCQQRAWEQSRAAASGRSAVEIVERVVEVPVARERAPRRAAKNGASLLQEVTAHLVDGRIYARDLPELGTALTDVVSAYDRRRKSRPLRR